MLETEYKKNDIYELLEAIEARPAMYLGSESLSLLRAFLDGFISGSQQVAPHPSGFIDFHEWVALRLGYFESTSGYANMILTAEAGDEEKGLDRFFRLWNEFRNRKRRVIYEAVRDFPPVVVSQRRLDSGEIEEMESNLIQIIKYTDDNSGFIKYVNGDREIREMYCQDLDRAFWLVNAFGFDIDTKAWKKVGD
ncbi:MAG: hypothetical protein ABL999_12600 [Pyrinomonadaceae bacterium]